jgi:hypothetical protein
MREKEDREGDGEERSIDGTGYGERERRDIQGGGWRGGGRGRRREGEAWKRRSMMIVDENITRDGTVDILIMHSLWTDPGPMHYDTYA